MHHDPFRIKSPRFAALLRYVLLGTLVGSDLACPRAGVASPLSLSLALTLLGPVAPDEEEEPPLKPPPATPATSPLGKPDDSPPGTTAAGQAGMAANAGENGTPNAESAFDRLVVLKGPRRATSTVPIQLLPSPLDWPPSARRIYEFTLFAPDRKTPKKLSFPGEDLYAIEYYELHMLARAAHELGVEVTSLTSGGPELNLTGTDRDASVRRAEAIISRALGEHDLAVQRGQRAVSDWRGVREQMIGTLFRLQMFQAYKLAQAKQVADALAVCDQLKPLYFRDSARLAELLKLYEQLILGPAVGELDEGNYASVHERLTQFGRRFPYRSSPLADQLRARLQRIAQDLVARAEQERKPELLDDAAVVWPELSGLEELRRRLISEYPVLKVAYRSLPASYSPLDARTPVERHAVALLFERLVNWREDERRGSYYVPGLAVSGPAPLPRGRLFSLPYCEWSDSRGEPAHLCTAEDVIWTVELMRKVRPAAFPAAWGQLLDTASRPANTDDPFQVQITLKHDHWQPLSFMDFYVLPKQSFPQAGAAAELERFAREPVGTGPYQRASSEDATIARFVANPVYRHRGRPLIREVVFQQMDSLESLDDFRRGKVQLVYDVRPQHVVELRRQGNQVIKLSARSLFSLAPNHRNPKLANLDLRLALAHAIDREEILNQHFRAGGNKLDHAALHGPFPARSWASNSRVSTYEPQQAALYFAKARATLGTSKIELNLIYPDFEPDVAEACAAIKRRLAEFDVALTIQAVAPQSLNEIVERRHSFELAYWRHDFDDETFWMWPLLDPEDAEAGGANFLGFVPDKDLRDLFHRMLTRKQFTEIRQAMYEIDEYFHRQVVFIPLWQIEPYVAVTSKLKFTRLDPVRLFDSIEDWSLQP